MRESRAWQRPGQPVEYPLPGPTDVPPVSRLCDAILMEALKRGATRVQLQEAEVALEIDGSLTPVMRVPLKVLPALIRRLKVMADLDIARHPSQSGYMSLRYDDRLVRARLTVEAVVPDAHRAMIEFEAGSPPSAAV